MPEQQTVDLQQARKAYAPHAVKPSNGLSVAGAGDETDSIDLDGLPTNGDVLVVLMFVATLLVVAVTAWWVLVK